MDNSPSSPCVTPPNATPCPLTSSRLWHRLSATLHAGNSMPVWCAFSASAVCVPYQNIPHLLQRCTRHSSRGRRSSLLSRTQLCGDGWNVTRHGAPPVCSMRQPHAMHNRSTPASRRPGPRTCNCRWMPVSRFVRPSSCCSVGRVCPARGPRGSLLSHSPGCSSS